MPATRQALRLTDAYRTRVGQLAGAVDLVVCDRWTQVNMAELDASYDGWLETAALTVTAAQREGVHLSDAYLASFLSAELGQSVPPQGLNADRLAGVSRDGRPLAEALLPPLFTVKMALAAGKGFEQSLREGLDRATRTVAREVVQTPRDALDQATQAEQRVIGWRRVTSGRACGACLAAATGAIQHEREVLRVHDHCHCTKEPVVEGAIERHHRPTGEQTFRAMSPEEQDQLYGEKAALIREGQVPFGALLATSPMKVLDDQITERPLEELQNLAA